MTNPAYLRTLFVLLIGVSAFNLGRYSVEFSGSTAAWVALIGNLVALAAALAALGYDFWGTNAERR